MGYRWEYDEVFHECKVRTMRYCLKYGKMRYCWERDEVLLEFKLVGP